MKKKLFTLLALAGAALQVQAQQAFYIHLDNGDVEVFYTDVVDSLTVASPAHEEGQTFQQVWTADSVYQYDLATIDRISYKTPDPVYRAGVKRLEDGLLAHVMRSEGLTLWLDAATPERMLPQVGELWVGLEMTDLLPYGFAGAVTAVHQEKDGCKVSCAPVALTDIFESYYGVPQPVPGPDGNPSYGRWKPGELSYEMDLNQTDIGMNSIWQYGCEAVQRISPSVDLRTALLVTPQRGTSLHLWYRGQYTLHQYSGLTGTFATTPNPEPQRYAIPLHQPLLKGNVCITPFGDATGQLSLKAQTVQSYVTALAHHWHKADVKTRPMRTAADVARQQTEVEGCLDGRLQMGTQVEVEIETADSGLGCLSTGTDMGVDWTGNGYVTQAMLQNADQSTAAYEQLSSAYVQGRSIQGRRKDTALQAPQCIEQENAMDKETDASGNLLAAYDLAPDFETLKADFNPADPSQLEVSVKVKGACLPVDLGLGVRQPDGTSISTAYVLRD